MRHTATLVLFVALLVAVVGSVAIAMLSGFLVDWLWFDALGFGAVFSTVWKAKVVAFGIADGASWVALAVNGLLAARTPALQVRRLRLVRGPGSSEGLPEVFDLSLEHFPWWAIVLAFATVLRHFSALLALFFLVKAGDYVLQRYDLLLSNNGVVFGAAYTDVYVRLPLLMGLAGVSLIAMALCAANLVFLSVRLPVAAVVL